MSSPQMRGPRAGKNRINRLAYPKVPDVFQEDIEGQRRKPAGRRPALGRKRGPSAATPYGFRKVGGGRVANTDIDPLKDT